MQKFKIKKVTKYTQIAEIEAVNWDDAKRQLAGTAIFLSKDDTTSDVSLSMEYLGDK